MMIRNMMLFVMFLVCVPSEAVMLRAKDGGDAQKVQERLNAYQKFSELGFSDEVFSITKEMTFQEFSDYHDTFCSILQAMVEGDEEDEQGLNALSKTVADLETPTMDDFVAYQKKNADDVTMEESDPQHNVAEKVEQNVFESISSKYQVQIQPNDDVLMKEESNAQREDNSNAREYEILKTVAFLDSYNAAPSPTEQKTLKKLVAPKPGDKKKLFVTVYETKVFETSIRGKIIDKEDGKYKWISISKMVDGVPTVWATPKEEPEQISSASVPVTAHQEDNAGSGSVSQDFNAKLLDILQSAKNDGLNGKKFKYYRFIPVALRDMDMARQDEKQLLIQLSRLQFQFKDGSQTCVGNDLVKDIWNVGSADSPGNARAGQSERPENLVKRIGDFTPNNKKWLAFRPEAVIIELDEPRVLTQYRLFRADYSPNGGEQARDPVSWVIQGTNKLRDHERSLRDIDTYNKADNYPHGEDRRLSGNKDLNQREVFMELAAAEDEHRETVWTTLHAWALDTRDEAARQDNKKPAGSRPSNRQEGMAHSEELKEFASDYPEGAFTATEWQQVINMNTNELDKEIAKRFGIANSVQESKELVELEHQFQYDERHFTNLQNLGNMCYLNAVLQAIVLSPEIVSTVMATPASDASIYNGPKFNELVGFQAAEGVQNIPRKWLAAFQEFKVTLLKMLHNARSPKIDATKRFIEAMLAYSGDGGNPTDPMFTIGKMSTAGNVWSPIRTLFEPLFATDKYTDRRPFFEDVFAKNFGVEKHISKTCEACGHKEAWDQHDVATIKIGPHRNWNEGQYKTLHKHPIAEKIMDGIQLDEDTKTDCDQNNCNGKMKWKLEMVKRWPNMLVVEDSAVVLPDRMANPEHRGLIYVRAHTLQENFELPEGPQNVKVKYELYAMVIHSGQYEDRGGHWYTLGKGRDGKIRIFDDQQSRVFETPGWVRDQTDFLNVKDGQTQNARMLFYRRVGSDAQMDGLKLTSDEVTSISNVRGGNLDAFLKAIDEGEAIKVQDSIKKFATNQIDSIKGNLERNAMHYIADAPQQYMGIFEEVLEHLRSTKPKEDVSRFVNAEDGMGKTPLEYATANKYQQIVEALRNYKETQEAVTDYGIADPNDTGACDGRCGFFGPKYSNGKHYCSKCAPGKKSAKDPKQEKINALVLAGRGIYNDKIIDQASKIEHKQYALQHSNSYNPYDQHSQQNDMVQSQMQYLLQRSLTQRVDPAPISCAKKVLANLDREMGVTQEQVLAKVTKEQIVRLCQDSNNDVQLVAARVFSVLFQD